MGRRRVRRRRPAGREDVPHPGWQQGRPRPRARARRRADRPAVQPLRRAAAARRGRLEDADLGADGVRRALVRARGGGLQGQHRHAPHRPARAQAARRGLPVRGQGDLRGLGGAGHRRPGGVRARERRPAASRRDPRRRHRQLRGRHSHAHEHAARHDERGCHAAGARQRDALRHVRRPGAGLARGPDPDARLAARRARQHDGRRTRRDTDLDRRRVPGRAVPRGRERARRREADGRRHSPPTCCGRARQRP